MLLLPEEIAGAADLQVAHRQLESRSQVLQLPDDVETLVGALAERPLHGVEEVRVGALPGPPDPAPELVELGQAEPVGVVDDDGVGVGDVQPGLDDGGADQHVDLAVDEGAHHRRQQVLVHLPVGDGDARLGHQRAHPFGLSLDGLHAVVDVEDLAAPGQLTGDHLAHQRSLAGGDVGLDGLALLGRGLDDREVADAGERHVQGARDAGWPRARARRRPPAAP